MTIILENIIFNKLKLNDKIENKKTSTKKENQTIRTQMNRDWS